MPSSDRVSRAAMPAVFLSGSQLSSVPSRRVSTASVMPQSVRRASTVSKSPFTARPRTSNPGPIFPIVAGADTLIDAEITRFLLNKKITQNFIKSIAFHDAKRMITKDLLMRINLINIVNKTSFSELEKHISDIHIGDWNKYKKYLLDIEFEKNQQLALFTN